MAPEIHFGLFFLWRGMKREESVGQEKTDIDLGPVLEKGVLKDGKGLVLTLL
jgi:hypothetical protein